MRSASGCFPSIGNLCFALPRDGCLSTAAAWPRLGRPARPLPQLIARRLRRVGHARMHSLEQPCWCPRRPSRIPNCERTHGQHGAAVARCRWRICRRGGDGSLAHVRAPSDQAHPRDFPQCTPQLNALEGSASEANSTESPPFADPRRSRQGEHATGPSGHQAMDRAYARRRLST